MKQPIWILVADRARARIFEVGSDETFTEVACLSEPDARAGESTLTTARPMTVNESMGGARHSIERHTPLDDKISARFAHRLRDALKVGLNEGRFEQLVLVAPPRFLGAIHAALDKALRARVVREIQHDYTTLPVSELRERIAA